MALFLPGRGARAVLGLALPLALLVSGCGGSGDDGGEGGGKDSKAQDTERGATIGADSPLTGLPVKGELPEQPVVVVKYDNTSSSRPQVGLGKADLVVEQLVEGGITRLAAMYYGGEAAVVGPVRSMRATDIGIVAPLDGVLVASGGAQVTMGRIKAAGIPMRTEGARGFFRDSGRAAPYNLMLRLPELQQALPSAPPPAPYLPFGDRDALPKGRPAKGLSVTFSPATTTQWQYDGGRYVNINSHTAEGDRFDPATVLVLRVEVTDAGYLDPSGSRVPETPVVGSGQAMVFHEGRVVRGTWSKPSPDGALSLESGGRSLELPPGKVWIELVPKAGGGVSVQRR